MEIDIKHLARVLDNIIERVNTFKDVYEYRCDAYKTGESFDETHEYINDYTTRRMLCDVSYELSNLAGVVADYIGDEGDDDR